MALDGIINTATSAYPSALQAKTTRSWRVADASSKTDGFPATQFPSLQEAVESFLTPDIQFAAFGEVHKEQFSNLPSTKYYFAEQIMPLLAKWGTKDLIFESLPFGEHAGRELLAFQKNGKLGALLTDWLTYTPSHCDVLRIFNQAGRLGIGLHGCHAKDKDEYAEYLIDDQIDRLIDQRALAISQRLIGIGKKVASYNGMAHNNTLSEKNYFGQVLYKKLADRYVEIDLLVPELVLRPKECDHLKLPDKWWSKYVPKKGVNLLSMPAGRKLIILPRFPKFKIHQLSEKDAKCN